MKLKKIDKDFLLSDNSVNVYGFRLLTEGWQKDLFAGNPIGYRMHDRKDGVVVRWEDLRVGGDKIYGKPVINLSHPKGEQTMNEVENGFLNAASVGHIVVLEISEDTSLMLPGQTGPTVTKWGNKEISLVDIPGNPNAMVQLFDAQENEINLTDFISHTLQKEPLGLLGGFNQNNKKTEKTMKNTVIKVLNLADTATDDVVEVALTNLVAKAASADALKLKKEALETELANFKKDAHKKEVDAILEKAIVEKRLTKELSDTLVVDYAEKPEALKKVVEAMKPYKSLVENLGKADSDVPELYKGKTYMELHGADLLEDVKNKFPNLFADLKKAHEDSK